MNSSNGAEPSVDWVEIRARLFRQRWLVLGSLLLVCLLAIAYIALAPRTYQATASLHFNRDVPQLVDGQALVDPVLTGQSFDRYLQTQTMALTSRDLAAKVAADLKLQAEPNIIATLRRNVSATNPPNSNILQITFRADDPQRAAAIANSYAENMIQGDIERRYQASSYAREFLAKELDRARQALEQSEREALAYTRAAGIVDTGAAPDGQGRISLSGASLVQMNADLASARSARIRAEERWRQAAQTPLMSLPEVLENATIQSLLAREAQLSADLGRSRETFQDQYPDVARIRAEIAAVREETNSLAQQIRSAIRENYTVAARQERAMANRISGLRSDSVEEQARRVNYDRLNRAAAMNRSLYEGLLQKYREVSTAAGITTNDISVLDRAVPPRAPSSPRVGLILALGLIGGLALGIALALLREFLADRIHSPDEVRGKLRLAHLGETPFVHPDDVAGQLALSRSPLAEAYHSIWSAIDVRGPETRHRSLLVTSTVKGEGKSTTALAVARDFARTGARTLLIDADIRLPALHGLLGLENGRGFSNLLAGEASFPDSVQRAGDLDFLAGGSTSKDFAQFLTSESVTRALSGLEQHYQAIVLDGPAVPDLADAVELARAVNGTIFVVEAGKVSRKRITASVRRLVDAKADVLGAVLTKFSPKASGYSAR